MFYNLSKWGLIFLDPVWLIFLLVLLYFLAKTRQKKKRYLILLMLVTWAFGNDYFIKSAIVHWQPPTTVASYKGTYSAGILLGGIVMRNHRGELFFGENADRFVQTAKLYHSGTIQHIIVAAGYGGKVPKPVNEGSFLETELIAQGIPDSVVFHENYSRNTAENAQFAKKLLDSLQLQPPYLLITTALHQRRAMASFKAQGLRVEPHNANYLVLENDFTLENLLIPRLRNLLTWPLILKEWVGYAAYRISGRAK